MIYEALKIITDNLNAYMRNRFSLSKDKVMMSNIVDKDNPDVLTDKDKIAVTLINIQQEKTIRAAGATQAGMNAPIHLNLFLLFSVYFGEDGSYEESLKELSSVISFFQANQVMNHHNTPDLDNRIEKMVFEFVNQDMQTLNYVWGMLGGKYVPSVMYKARMISIQEGNIDSFIGPFMGFGSNKLL